MQMDKAWFSEQVRDREAAMYALAMSYMKQEDDAIAAITGNTEPPTFQNTVDVNTGEQLENITSIFFNLVSANTSDEMDELAQKLSPMLTEHYARIMHNEQLFQRVKQVWENPGKHPTSRIKP